VAPRFLNFCQEFRKWDPLPPHLDIPAAERTSGSQGAWNRAYAFANGERLEKERVVGKTERNVARIVVGSPPRGRLRIASFQYLDGDLVGYKVVVAFLLLLKVNYIYALRVIIFACVGKLQPEPCTIDPIRGITTRRNLDGESASEHIIGLGEGYRVHQDGNKDGDPTHYRLLVWTGGILLLFLQSFTGGTQRHPAHLRSSTAS
jgi:hypothetical protein